MADQLKQGASAPKASKARRRKHHSVSEQFTQAYDEGDRPGPCKNSDASTALSSVLDRSFFLHCHSSRRQTHGQMLLTVTSGEVEVNVSIFGLIESLTNDLRVDIRHHSRRGRAHVYEFMSTVVCCKDTGGTSLKDCQHRVPVDHIIRQLAQMIVACPTSAPTVRAEIVRAQRFLENADMAARIAADRSNREHSRVAYYAICPQGGCEFAEGYQIHHTAHARRIIWCPNPECRNEHGEPTHWCSLCETIHLPTVECPLQDLRAKWTKEERDFHDGQVAQGLETYCKCGTVYAKDDGCASVHCARPGCGAHMCFDCGAELTANYLENHLTDGPARPGAAPAWGGRYLGCRRTFIRRAIANEDGLRAWVQASIDCCPLMLDAVFILEDQMRPIVDEERTWLTGIVDQARERGVFFDLRV